MPHQYSSSIQKMSQSISARLQLQCRLHSDSLHCELPRTRNSDLSSNVTKGAPIGTVTENLNGAYAS